MTNPTHYNFLIIRMIVAHVKLISRYCSLTSMLTFFTCQHLQQVDRIGMKYYNRFLLFSTSIYTQRMLKSLLISFLSFSRIYSTPRMIRNSFKQYCMSDRYKKFSSFFFVSFIIGSHVDIIVRLKI